MTDKGVEAAVQEARFYGLCEEFLSSANNHSLEKNPIWARQIGAAFKAVVDADRNSQGPVNREKYPRMLSQLNRVAAVSGLRPDEVVEPVWVFPVP